MTRGPRRSWRCDTPRLRQVAAVDHTVVLGLLADRHHDLTGPRTQAICRLHALLCGLTPGGAGCLLSAPQAGRILRGVRPLEPVEIERKGIALALLGDVRRFDSQLIATNQRISEAKRSPDWDAEGPFAPGCRPAYPNSLRANRTGPRWVLVTRGADPHLLAEQFADQATSELAANPA
jgi:hypothetical protein